MSSTALIAVAGSGKTEWLARAALQEPNPARVAILTYTTTNQHEDALRLAMRAQSTTGIPTVCGWRSFVLNEIVKPYLPTLFPDVELKGLAFDDPPSFQYLSGTRRHFTQDGRAYPSLLGKLAFDIIKASKGRAIQRIECLYDSIYIDESQDLRGNDLNVLLELLKSSIDVHIVLDPRQSTLSTAPKDAMYKKHYSFAAVANLFKDWESKKLLTITYLNETKRFTEMIAQFSDLILEDSFGFSATISNVPERGFHDGIFLVDQKKLKDYSFAYRATALAVQESQKINAYESVNFGKSKGITRDDVVIKATKPIEDLLIRGKRLSPGSACGFYVAVTRARYSVALAVNNPEKTMEAMTAHNSIWKGVNVQIVRCANVYI